MPIRPREGRAVGFAFTYFFLLMSGYYLLRPLRDAMASGVVEDLFSFYAGTFTVMLLLTPLFGALVSRVRKPLLLPIAYGFFASNLLAFYLLFKSMPDSSALAAAFFVWLSVYNMFVVSVFWSFMADVFRDEEAKRLFGPIAAGGGTGAIVGPLVMQYLAPRIGVDAVVFLAMLLLLGTLPCIRTLAQWAEARHGRFVLPPGDPEARIGGGILSGLHDRRAFAVPARDCHPHRARFDRGCIHVQRTAAPRRFQLSGSCKPCAVFRPARLRSSTSPPGSSRPSSSAG